MSPLACENSSAVHSFVRARGTIRQLQAAAGDVYQALSRLRGIDRESASSTLKMIALYGESADLLLIELADQIGLVLPKSDN